MRIKYKVSRVVYFNVKAKHFYDSIFNLQSPQIVGQKPK